MNKPRLTFWFFIVAGLLWLIVGLLRSVQHDSALEIGMAFVAGFIFLLLGWQQANKQRTV
jgi:hypothetical protein